MKRGIVVGKEVRPYEKNGEQKWARTLHVIWDESRAPQDGEQGQKVEAMYVRFPVDNVSVGDYCGFVYDVVPGRNGAMAILSEIVVLGKAEIEMVRPQV